MLKHFDTPRSCVDNELCPKQHDVLLQYVSRQRSSEVNVSIKLPVRIAGSHCGASTCVLIDLPYVRCRAALTSYFFIFFSAYRPLTSTLRHLLRQTYYVNFIIEAEFFCVMYVDIVTFSDITAWCLIWNDSTVNCVSEQRLSLVNKRNIFCPTALAFELAYRIEVRWRERLNFLWTIFIHLCTI